MTRCVYGLIGALSVLVAACDSTPPQPIEFWTGAVHGTLYGRWGTLTASEGPPTSACDPAPMPPLDDPPSWWAGLGQNITGGVDAVGYTYWSNENTTCSRGMQTVYRSVMMFDISGIDPSASSPADLAGRINTAELQFSIIEQAPINPAGWACPAYTGALGRLSTLRPGATVTTGLTMVGGLAGSVGPAGVIAAFPLPGTPLGDIGTISGPGTRDRFTASDTGPGVHDVRVDVKDVLLGAINNSRPELGFTIQSIGETNISPPNDIQFVCRTFVRPVQLRVTHW